MEGDTSNVSKKKLNEIKEFIENKKQSFIDILHRQTIAVNQQKMMDIISSSSLGIFNECLEVLFKNIHQITSDIKKNNYNDQLSHLQNVTNDISSLFKKYGCSNLNDMIQICLDKNYIQNNVQEQDIKLVNLLAKVFQPISYKSILWSNIPDNLDEQSGLLEDFSIAKHSKNFHCYPLRQTDNFKMECSGMKVVIHNSAQKRTLIVNGIIHEISLQCINNEYIFNKIAAIKELDNDIEESLVDRYISSLTLKELLIYSALDLRSSLYSNISSMKIMKTKPLMSIVKQFSRGSIMDKRNTIIQLLLFNNEADFQYIAYLLYDLLTSDSNNMIDSKEQTMLYDSLPVVFKKYFKDAMNNTLAYTEELYNFSNNIPLEQQICLMKVNDSVKEKAMIKLKEIKSKSDDTGSKARQYLEGLLRIPFGQYTKEEIMEYIPDIINKYNKVVESLPSDMNFDTCETYIEIQNRFKMLLDKNDDIDNHFYEMIMKNFSDCKKSKLVKNVGHINQFLKKNSMTNLRITHSGKTNDSIRNDIESCIETIHKDTKLWDMFMNSIQCDLYKEHKFINANIDSIKKNVTEVQDYMKYIDTTLDNSVYGHDKAKQQIKRIVGQWITGENSGYCFGFEGPPGVGKTSLAKNGIAKCLLNHEGESRPFSFIAIGGSSNGSTFEGHNYTYVGSTWGKIVDILMESKCMNPIIFIDELDKISKTRKW